LSLAFAAGAKIFLTRDMPMAADGAHYVYAGCGPREARDGALRAGMLIDGELMKMARPGAQVLLGQETGCRVEDELRAAYAALERERFAMRLRVQRLIWNWLLRENEENG
jgi:hypothetical protein